MSPAIPSAGRIAALGLLTAALTILVLAVLGLYEVRTEVALHRDMIGSQLAKDNLESLSGKLHALKYSARVHALTASAAAAQEIERRLVEIDADLEYLAERERTEPGLAPMAANLVGEVRAYAFHVRSAAATARSRSPAAADAMAGLAASLEQRAREALDRAIEAQSQRIYEGSTAQIRVAENLKLYVSTLLVGSILVLTGLFATYLYAQARMRAVQQRIERLAHFDAVTSLPNRSLLADRFEQELARARRGKKALAVVLFDLDGFKAVNDTLGHAAGDALLAEVGRRLHECIRASDTVGRLGGDEFLALLPDAGREGAVQVAEKIRTELARPCWIGGKEVAISTSVGVGLFPEHGDEPDTLFRAADAALYSAKRSGRNRTLVASATG